MKVIDHVCLQGTQLHAERARVKATWPAKLLDSIAPGFPSSTEEEMSGVISHFPILACTPKHKSIKIRNMLVMENSSVI